MSVLPWGIQRDIQVSFAQKRPLNNGWLLVDNDAVS
jgi:hypothetical protein